MAEESVALTISERPSNSNHDRERQSVVRTEARIKSEALTGLRGLASLHILVFHALKYCPFNVDIIGAIELPLFFLLSGYCLALSYGRTMYDGHTSCCCTRTTSQPEAPVVLFKTFNFYRNRFARVMPMYYLANFVLALPLLAFGHGWITLAHDNFVIRMVTMVMDSIAPIGMILPSVFWPLVGASWTISTLWCFYLCFPFIFPTFQKFSNEKASSWIKILFWVQFLVGIILAAVLWLVPLRTLPEHTEHILGAYWVSTGWGVCRLPVFLMGVLSGLLRMRHYIDPNIGNRSDINFIYAWMPWNCKFYPEDARKLQYQWTSLVRSLCSAHLIFITLFALLNSFVSPKFSYRANWAIQLIGVHSLLTVIDGLTRDGGRSLLAQLCNLRVTQELGRISMTLYLIHEPLLKWLCVAVKGNLNGRPPDTDRHIMPTWGIPVVIVACPLVAWVLTKYVEEPLRKLLRAPKNTS